MNTDFLFNAIRRDLNALQADKNGDLEPQAVQKVLDLWEANVDAKKGLSSEMKRLQVILNSNEKVDTRRAHEAMNIIMMMHYPLIEHNNDAVGIRLRDVYYFRLLNRIMNLPLETGFDNYTEQVEEYHDKLQRQQQAKKARDVEKAQQRKEEAAQIERAKSEQLAQQIARALKASESNGEIL